MVPTSWRTTALGQRGFRDDVQAVAGYGQGPAVPDRAALLCGTTPHRQPTKQGVPVAKGVCDVESARQFPSTILPTFGSSCVLRLLDARLRCGHRARLERRRQLGDE